MKTVVHVWFFFLGIIGVMMIVLFTLPPIFHYWRLWNAWWRG